MSSKRKRTQSSDALSQGDSLLAQLDALSSSSAYPKPGPVDTSARKRQKVAPFPADALPPPQRAGSAKVAASPSQASSRAPPYSRASPSTQAAGPSAKAGPSQSKVSQSSPHFSPAKPKKKKDEEKRPGRYRSRCPVAILERLDRVLSQRFYMVDRNRREGELIEQFSVLGSTGNVYTVIIGPKPSCDCPDALKGNHCKHIIFVFIKVLQVSQESGLWFQSGLLTSELEVIFSSAPKAPNAAAKHVQDAYDRATGKKKEKQESTPAAQKMPEEGDDCAICYESMHGQSTSALVWCHVCKNALHKECFGQYKNLEMGRGKRSVNCVYCRSEWPTAAPAGGSGGARKSEGYLNLAHAVGMSTERDTSTYYHGPTRSPRSYGYGGLHGSRRYL